MPVTTKASEDADTYSDPPIQLPSDYHLRGPEYYDAWCIPEHYDVWCIQMRGVAGPAAYKLMTGEVARGEGGLSLRSWDRLNDYAISTMLRNCHVSVLHYVIHGEYHARVWWDAFRSVFRPPPTAQSNYRLLTRLWSLSLPNSSPEAVKPFLKEHEAIIRELTAAEVDLETIFSSHLLYALPASLDSFRTALLVSAQDKLPARDTILNLIRNEILLSSVSNSAASVAQNSFNRSDRSPPSPCPACSADHWLVECAKRPKNRRRRKRSAKTASAVSAPTSPRSPPHLPTFAEIYDGFEW